jgi:Putative beta-barrel porin-2, OmpL-like. bbp2
MLSTPARNGACTALLFALCTLPSRTFAQTEPSPAPLVTAAPAEASPAAASPAPSLAPSASAAPSPAPAAPAPAAPAPAAPAPAPTRRALDAPLDPIFPSADFLGPTIGVPNDTTVFPLQKALFPKSDGNGVRVYGWVDPGVLFATSQHSSYPLTYNVDPNMINLDQLILRIERQPDTTQTDHFDWGFRVSNLFGIDYRWTTAAGYLSDQLLAHNQLYGDDPVELYGLLYFPKLGQGTEVQLGRFISPPDIEAQLAPNNYLYSHSIFFDFDAYTQTGALFSTKLSNYWSIQYGLHAGDDMAPWYPSQHFPQGEFMVRYVTHANRDSLLFGVDALNLGGDSSFKTFTSGGVLYGHDNLQQSNFTWTHVFNSGFHNLIETYYLYTYNAYVGGTINEGPPRFGGGGGAGPFLPGRSVATGVVDYLEKKFAPKDFWSFRTDYMNDPSGWRSGFPTAYGSLTFGITHKMSDLEMIRPEIRYEQAFRAGVTPYDNGTRASQTSFGMDFIRNF